MTNLSVNLNKIALLRNSRGRDYPNVVKYAKKFIDLGVQGITIHPRQDERHAKRQDAYDLGELCRQVDNVEFNIEGYPNDDFLSLVTTVKPDQCTLVPDDVDQLTSDHGWDIDRSQDILRPALARIHNAGVRVSLFVDPDQNRINSASQIGADRIELYTEAFANRYQRNDSDIVFKEYKTAATLANSLGLGVNAGHDLDLNNLARFLEIENIAEVSIGHALTIECIDRGMAYVISRYLDICAAA